MKTIAVVAPGAMGSAIAGLLTHHHLEVLTLTQGRSQARPGAGRQKWKRSRG